MKTLILMGTFLSTFSSTPVMAGCDIKADLKAASVEWTAFKTTDKAAVGGSFTDVVVKGADHGRDLKRLMQSLKATIKASSVETKNPARNAKLVEFFFDKFKKKAKVKDAIIEGKIKNFKGVEQGTFDLAMTLGGKTKSVPMEFTFEVDKETKAEKLVALGEISVLDFGGDAPLKSLNEACVDLHKGKDGVSKTWPDVKLKLSLPVTKDCK